MKFSDFDRRGYRTVDVRTGYAAWVPTYENTVEDAMDIALLEALKTPRWQNVVRAVDLGCGTGRTGAWLRQRGVATIDGADVTPEMLAVARSTGVYCSLVVADATSTGMESGAYDLVTACLIDEHLPDLHPLYDEAWRLAKSGALLVLVGYHPHFIMAAGMPTHFTTDTGEHVAIDTHIHLISEHVKVAKASGWDLEEMIEQTINEHWLALKPKWGRLRNHPISFAFVWRKPI